MSLYIRAVATKSASERLVFLNVLGNGAGDFRRAKREGKNWCLRLYKQLRLYKRVLSRVLSWDGGGAKRSRVAVVSETPKCAGQYVRGTFRVPARVAVELYFSVSGTLRQEIAFHCVGGKRWESHVSLQSGYAF